MKIILYTAGGGLLGLVCALLLQLCAGILNWFIGSMIQSSFLVHIISNEYVLFICTALGMLFGGRIGYTKGP